MIRELKKLGYRLALQDTLNNREFREVEQSYTLNEDYSTFAEQKYDLEEVIELFLATRTYSKKKVKDILDKTRSVLIDKVAVTIEEQERGYLITFITIKEGVEWLQI